VSTATAASARGQAVRPGDLRLLVKQVGYEQRAFWRNRTAAFFTFLLPVMFLVIFSTIFGNQDPQEVGGQEVPFVTFFVPGILAFGIVGTTFSNLAINISYLREMGVLKRVRGTPLPRWIFLAGLVGSAVITTLALTAVMLTVGVLVYDVAIRTETLLAVAVMLVLGTAAFSALGLAISSAIPNGDAAPAVTNALVLPLSFFSGVWFSVDDAPQWVATLAGLFPLKPLADGLQHAFLPGSAAPGLKLANVLWLAGWFVVGAVIAVRTFKWGAGRE
jgi:ABC-2 type transport system permease protein